MVLKLLAVDLLRHSLSPQWHRFAHQPRVVTVIGASKGLTIYHQMRRVIGVSLHRPAVLLTKMT